MRTVSSNETADGLLRGAAEALRPLVRTGITTAQGNVASAATALRGAPRLGRPTAFVRLWQAMRWATDANARGPLEDIRVTIEGTSLGVQTDPQGQFGLSGDFAGPVGMVFELPDGGRARLVVTVPRGGALTLTNIHLDGRTGRATVDEQRVRFDGLVDATDCGRSSARVVSRRSPDDGNHYTVRFVGTRVRDRSETAVGCADLAPGAEVDVDGEVRREGEVEAESVEVKDRGSGGRGGKASGDGRESSAGSQGAGGGEDGEDEDGGQGGGTSSPHEPP